MSWSINGVEGTERKIATAYDANEVTESMGPLGVVYSVEIGYVAVEKGQHVMIWPGTATHGHGGNKFDEYVWCMTLEQEQGWLPVELLEVGPLPEETAAIEATVPLPEETAASAATVLPSEESVAIAATGPPPVARQFLFEFDC